MKVSERQVGSVTMLDVEGRMTVEVRPESRVFRAARRLLRDGRMHLLVNLAGVPHTDSTGLADLVASCTTAVRQGGFLKLEHLTPHVRKLLEITQLIAVLNDFESEEDALASFQHQRHGRWPDDQFRDTPWPSMSEYTPHES